MDSLLQTNTDIDNIQVAQAFMCSPEDCHRHITTSKHLTILTQNIRSIYKNLDNFQVTLNSIKVECDVLVMTECHLSDYKPIPTLSINYNTYYTKNTINQCDGVIFYVHKKHNCKIFEPCIKNASCLVLTLKDTVIIGIYRTPSIRNTDDFIYSLQTLLNTYDKFQNIIVTGDINIDIKLDATDRNLPNYLTSLAYHGLLPAHRFPTRNKMCYDHMMLKAPHLAKCLVLTNAPTDHSTVLLNLMYKSNEARCSVRTRVSVDYNATINEIKNNLTDILELQNPNQAAETLISRISTALNNNRISTIVPSRKCCIQPWITPGVLRCIRNRDKLHFKVKKNPDDHILKMAYTRYRNFCNKLIRNLKNCYERKKLDSSNKNTKALWKNIKSICCINKKKTNDTHKLTTLSDTPLESANFVNKHFSTLGKTLAEKIINSPSPANKLNSNKNSTPVNSFVLLNTDPSEINTIINNLSNYSASGPDGIPTLFVKLARPTLIPILCHIYNLCFEKGQFPSIFKIALVTPIHKDGSKDDVGNYRPISVLSVMSKILEKLINNRLKKFLSDNDLISNNQYGFRNGISTEEAVLGLTREIGDHLDVGNKCVGVFLDLAKAFDTVSIPILLNKLLDHGIRGLPHDLLSDYLTNREQQVKLDNFVSQPSIISYGVPQGSVLGPTLFLIYINDLCNYNLPNCKIYTYADDTALIFNATSWESLKSIVESGIHQIQNWLKFNLLTLNINKTKYMTFAIRKSSLPNNTFNITAHTCETPGLNNCSCFNITKTCNIKYLGVIIDQHLTWRQHIISITDRMRKLMWVFKKLRHVANEKVLITTYKALAQSVLSYCIPVWGGAAKTHLITLERAQRALLKIMFFKQIRFSTFDLHNFYKILTTRQIYILSVILLTHRQLTYISPNLLPRRRSNTSICRMSQCKTKFKQKQFTAQSSSLYNKFNTRLNIYPLTSSNLKRLLTQTLLTFDYDKTETFIN